MLGPNGVGKSTIFNLITGLISPEKGSIFIGGEKVNNFPIFLRTTKFKIGYVPQYGGYFYDLNENIQLIPALMTRYVSGAPFDIDFSVSARFYDKYELGGNYSLNDSVSIMTSLEIVEMLDLGIAYDFVSSDIKDQTSGGPEFFLKVKF